MLNQTGCRIQTCDLQKQPFADVLQNRCSSKFRDIHTFSPKTLLKRDSNTGVVLQNTSVGCFWTSLFALIWVGFLGVRFEVKGGVKLPPLRLKIVRVMLET